MTREDQTVWDLYFASICSLRFHPRNDQNMEPSKHKVAYAADIADMMMNERNRRIKKGPS